ncbi:MAG: glycoside hydrolase family 3 protein [Chlorobiaceae bacterium]|nr:glycoside hydrolase family 3 protein [Chlorobiaceae bacterium]
MNRKSLLLLPFLLLTLQFLFSMPSAFAKSKPGGEKWRAQQIFSRQDPSIETALLNMSLSEKVGQMLIAQSDGEYNRKNDNAYQLLSRLVQEGKVGGIMFLKGNTFGSSMLANHFQAIAPRPLLLSADMERGLAMRLSGATEFPPNMAVAATRNPELAARMAKAIALEAKAVGLHQNYAPTVDLNINPLNPVINTRSFGDNVPLATTMANAIIESLQSNGVIATVKHFPGHGDVTVDSHISLPVLQADRQRLDAYELKPFRSAIEHGVISVMTGHLAVPKLTGTMEPASVSKVIVTDLLRKELGFQGLIITDALNMKALYNGENVPDISIKAVLAGNDLLLFSPDPELAHSSIVKAVEDGVISMEQVNTSVRRILQVKLWLGIEERKLVNLNRVNEESSPESHRALAKEIAARSITLVKDANHYLPIKPLSTEENILNIILQDKAESETGKGYCANLDRYYKATHIRINPGTDSLSLANTLEQAGKASAVIITSYVQIHSGSGTLKLTAMQQQFVHSLALTVPKEKPLILVSLGTPYLINYFPEITTYLCTYSSSQTSEENVIDVLRGTLVPHGVIPVSLLGAPSESGTITNH